MHAVEGALGDPGADPLSGELDRRPGEDAGSGEAEERLLRPLLPLPLRARAVVRAGEGGGSQRGGQAGEATAGWRAAGTGEGGAGSEPPPPGAVAPGGRRARRASGGRPSPGPPATVAMRSRASVGSRAAANASDTSSARVRWGDEVRVHAGVAARKRPPDRLPPDGGLPGPGGGRDQGARAVEHPEALGPLEEREAHAGSTVPLPGLRAPDAATGQDAERRGGASPLVADAIAERAARCARSR